MRLISYAAMTAMCGVPVVAGGQVVGCVDPGTPTPASLVFSDGTTRPLIPGVDPEFRFPVACYDHEHPPTVEKMLRLEQRAMMSVEGPYGPRYFTSGTQWGTQGQPTTITWSFMPDGVSIPGDAEVGDPTAPSNMFATLDNRFGGAANRAVWIGVFEQCFDRWSALTGIEFVRVTSGGNPWDDGAVFSSQASAARGTVRIGAHAMDGVNSVLAYAYYPGSGGATGNMVLDSAEAWGTAANDYRYMRNIIMHELGHAVGIRHVCPANGTKLMEPFLTTAFDGPQHDDIRGGQWLYADEFEPNDTAIDATFFGFSQVGVTANISQVQPAVAQGSLTSLTTSDQDVFKGIAVGNVLSTITVTPVGQTQNLNQQTDVCVAGPTAVNSAMQGDVWFEVFGPDGTTLWDHAFSAPTGQAETLSGILLPGGNFYVRVRPLGTVTGTQAYTLTVRGDSQPTIAATDNAFANIVRVTWSEVPGGGPYKLYRSTTNSRASATLRTTQPGTVFQFDDNSVVVGTTYYYWIETDQGFASNKPMAGPTAGTAGLIPSNNACANAATLTLGVSQNGSTTLASNDGTATCGTSSASKDVWYNFTAPCTGTVGITTCGTHDTGGEDAGMDTVLALYPACPGTTGNQILCNDDATGGTCSRNDDGAIRDSALIFSAVAGQTFKVRVAGFNNTAGNFTINSFYFPPANDLCANAIDVSDGSYAFGTCGAVTDGPAEPAVGNFFGYNQVGSDAWYRYTPTCDGIASINLCNSTYDTKVAVYTGSCPTSPGTAIACNDDSTLTCGNTRSYLEFPADNNQQYLIRVGGYQGATGSGTMVLACQGTCGTSDFNNDGDFGTDADIEAFFACLGGNCCPLCGTSDFNADGDFGTDADIEAFFRVLGGGNC
jgi:hypothetical protein